MDSQLYFAQKISKKSLKLAEIDSCEYRVKIGFFLAKKTNFRKNPGPPFKAKKLLLTKIFNGASMKAFHKEKQANF